VEFILVDGREGRVLVDEEELLLEELPGLGRDSF
jgi:hypothetical protein